MVYGGREPRKKEGGREEGRDVPLGEDEKGLEDAGDDVGAGGWGGEGQEGGEELLSGGREEINRE